MGNAGQGTERVAEISELPVPDGAVAFWWLGQASVVARIGDATVYIDPYLSESERRLAPPPFRGDEVTNADLLLITHGHGDHLDVAALPMIASASPAATIVAPRPLLDQVAGLVGDADRVVPADAGRAIGWRDIEILPVAAKHEAFDLDPDLGYPYLGYVLQAPGVVLYHAGDTIPYDGLAEALAPLAIDLALLPINGRDWFRAQRGIAGNMDAREAAELACLLDVDTVVPIHYGMFAGNTASPGAFAGHLQTIAPRVHLLIPAVGRACIYRPARTRTGGPMYPRRAS